MKNIIGGFCLLSIVYFFPSCSSTPDETKKDTLSTTETSTTVDTSLHGLTGVIEKNPPVQQGDYTLKYPNGLVKMRGFYINGKRNGQWSSFFENGKIQSEGFFKDGLRDGKAIVYYDNGQLYYTGFYNNGKEAGVWVFYDQTGKEMQKKDYNQPNP